MKNNQKDWNSVNNLECYEKHSKKGLDCNIVVDTNNRIKSILDEIGFTDYEGHTTDYAGEWEYCIGFMGKFDTTPIGATIIWYDKMGELTYRAELRTFTFFRDLKINENYMEGMSFEISFVNLLDKTKLLEYIERLKRAVEAQRYFTNDNEEKRN